MLRELEVQECDTCLPAGRQGTMKSVTKAGPIKFLSLLRTYGAVPLPLPSFHNQWEVVFPLRRFVKPVL